MGHQQQVLYIAGLITVGAAIWVGIQKLESSHQKANINALTLDLLDIATKAQAYYFTPEYLGGGDHSFYKLSTGSPGLEELLVNSENENGSFKILSSGSHDFLVIQAIGKDDYDGDGQNLTIEMKVYADSVQTMLVNY